METPKFISSERGKFYVHSTWHGERVTLFYGYWLVQTGTKSRPKREYGIVTRNLDGDHVSESVTDWRP